MTNRPSAELVRRLYVDEGMASAAIAKATGVSKSTIVLMVRAADLPRHKNSPPHPSGDQHPCWKASEAGYTALHDRVTNARGKPSHCQRCGLSDPAAKYEWANLTGQYDDVNDFERMCIPCHRQYDAGRRNPTPKSRYRPQANRICITCGKDRPHAGRGRCTTCYPRLRRQGIFAAEDAAKTAEVAS